MTMNVVTLRAKRSNFNFDLRISGLAKRQSFIFPSVFFLSLASVRCGRTHSIGCNFCSESPHYLWTTATELLKVIDAAVDRSYTRIHFNFRFYEIITFCHLEFIRFSFCSTLAYRILWTRHCIVATVAHWCRRITSIRCENIEQWFERKKHFRKHFYSHCKMEKSHRRRSNGKMQFEKWDEEKVRMNETEKAHQCAKHFALVRLRFRSSEKCVFILFWRIFNDCFHDFSLLLAASVTFSIANWISFALAEIENICISIAYISLLLSFRRDARKFIIDEKWKTQQRKMKLATNKKCAVERREREKNNWFETEWARGELFRFFCYRIPVLSIEKKRHWTKAKWKIQSFISYFGSR